MTDDVAHCEHCIEEIRAQHIIGRPDLATVRIDDEWLCDYHAEKAAQQTDEREADERNSQDD